MSEHSGFIDLRVGHSAQGVGDESVWPSFTDIMTVIVMIFLMALVVIMVRNFELDRQLVSTTSAREAATLANRRLAEELIRLEHTLADSRDRRRRLEENLDRELLRLNRLSAEQEVLKADLASVVALRDALEQENQALRGERESARREIDTLVAGGVLLNQKIDGLTQQLRELEVESRRRIVSLSADKSSLSDKLDTVSGQLQGVQALLEEYQGRNQELVRRVAELEAQGREAEQRTSIANEEILALTALIRQREAENAALETEAAGSSRRYQSLQEEFDSLDRRYRELIRAARSPAGKYVVEVWVEKGAAGFVYHVKTPEDADRVRVTRVQLDENLSQLKSRHADSLYTRIVIPEDSQLSHNEAWTFTQDILQKYDYYYQ